VVNDFVTAQGLEFLFIDDGNAIRVVSAGERGRVAPIGNLRDLRSRESDHMTARVIPVHHIEVVKVAPGSPHDDNAGGFFVI